MERGRQIAHFQILGEIGAGGMGAVYRARDRVLGRDVALKLIRPDKATPDLRQRFLEEARIAATLAHPGIAAVYEAGEAEDPSGGPSQIYVAQELIEGETLAALVGRGPLPVDQAIDLVVQLLDALTDAHARGIVHRDIKPSNLMIAPSGRLKVLDFGIARRLVDPAETTHLTGERTLAAGRSADTFVGTPGYMAPEQLRGIANRRTDLFAAGCVLYELLAGQRLMHPFASGLSEQDAATPSAAVRLLRPDLPAPLLPVIDRALAFDPDGRFPDAAAFAAALRAAAAGNSPSARPGRARMPARLRRVLIPVAAVALLALVTFGIWRWSRPTLAFSERDMVLVANVVNQTGDTVFDRALEGAFETDLRQSRYVNVFDDGRLASTLQMMRLPPTTRIDLQTGRDVCRIAGIRVLLIPSVLSIGNAYHLEASLVEPASGRVVDSLRVTASGREEVLERGIDELTRLVRRRLGESLPSIQKTDPSLVEYATPSWEALRFLKLAGEALGAADVPRAARALEQSLQHDPNFPAALGSLGLLYIELLNKPDEGRRMLTAALEHSNPTSVREHVMVRAMHRQFVANDPTGALEDYRFVSSLYPDMFQPYNNSGRILSALGKYKEAVEKFEKAHALDPRHTVPLWNLWELSLNRLDDPLAAERYAKMLESLQPDNPWIRHLAAWTDVAFRRFDRAEQGMRNVLSAVPLHMYAFPNLGHLLLRRGAAVEAVEVYRELLDNARRRLIDLSTPDAALFLGLALSAAGREAEARPIYESAVADLARPAAQSAPYAQAQLAALHAALGRRRQAEALSRSLRAAHPDNVWILYVLARAHALLGDAKGASDLLRRCRQAGWSQPYLVLIDPAFRTLQDHPVVAEIAVLPPGQ
jgi:tetratricopeptide (TPR) repeat protein